MPIQPPPAPIELDPPGWTRRDVPEAGISIASNPGWPVLAADHISYQTFGSDSDAITVHWGDSATIEWVLDYRGLGSGGATRFVDEDRSETIAGLPARRITLRVISRGMGHGLDSEGRSVGAGSRLPRETIYVAVGFAVNGKPVLVGYRLSQSERAELEPLLERVLRGVRPL